MSEDPGEAESRPTRRVPGLGFQPDSRGKSFRDFYQTFSSLRRDEFVERCGSPFLVSAVSVDPGTWDTAVVLRVVRRPSSTSPPSQITVGRSTSCDITVSHISVSKNHGYFSREGDAWGFTDLGSSNGTSVNEADVAPNIWTRLTGDLVPVDLGDVRLTFFTPGGIYDFFVEIRRSQGRETPEDRRDTATRLRPGAIPAEDTGKGDSDDQIWLDARGRPSTTRPPPDAPRSGPRPPRKV